MVGAARSQSALAISEGPWLCHGFGNGPYKPGFLWLVHELLCCQVLFESWQSQHSGNPVLCAQIILLLFHSAPQVQPPQASHEGRHGLDELRLNYMAEQEVSDKEPGLLGSQFNSTRHTCQPKKQWISRCHTCTQGYLQGTFLQPQTPSQPY